MYAQAGRAACPICQQGGHRHNPALSISRGHAGQLLLWCFKGCGFRDVLAALQIRGIVPGTVDWSPPSPEILAKIQAKAEAQNRKRALQAQSCWAETVPITGSPAQTYLQARGITCALPETLRYHPECWHCSGQRHPALIARVDGADRFAVHRTYLRRDGAGKASVTPNKAMLGGVKGGAVRLAQGTGVLVVCEGIETGLSLAQSLACRTPNVWAALSTSGLTALRLPAVPHHLVIAPDGDAAGRKAADCLARRADSLGWELSIMQAPDGCDFNDILKEQASV